MSAAADPLLDACYCGIGAIIRLLGASEGGSVHEEDGALSALTPLIPMASLFNATIFNRSRPESLDAALGRMWPIYEESPVASWSVWIPDGEAEAERIAAAHEMAVDSTPRAMGSALSELDLARPTDGVEERWDMKSVATLNERAYNLPPGLFGASDSTPQPERARCFIASDEGRPVSAVVTLPNGDEDCTVAWVATSPAQQGKGFGKATMTAALKAAAEDGFNTTTLQSSAAGAPLYASLGYRDLGVAINLWQYKRAPMPH